MGALLILAPGGVAQAGDALAVDMFRHVVAQEKGNVVFSPASAEAVLHMLREGAAGQTKAELDALPYGKQGVPSSMRVESANALFAADNMQLKPLSVSDIHRVPFATAPSKAANAVNAWCKEKTHGRIDSILNPQDVNSDTRLIAINAVYLKEKWATPFNKARTHEDKFMTPGGKKQTVQMMTQDAKFAYAKGGDWQAIALPYSTTGRKGQPGYFIGILPSGDARAFAASLTPQKMDAIRSALAAAQPAHGVVSLPRFQVNTPSVNLNNVLMQLGLRSAFSGKANFTGFSNEPLILSKVQQRCFVQVDEEGTEAAAVTAAMMERTVRRYRFSIRFNRPFLWVIGDLTTDAPPYFMGLMEKP